MKPNKITLYLILALLLANIAEAEKYFVLDLNYILGSITFNSRSLRETDTRIKYADKSGFLIKTVSFQNADLDRLYYNMSENKNYIIYVPYNENAARIEVYNPKNSLAMDIDVSSYADTCGNKLCEEHESYESCTKDCPSGGKDDFCDEVKDAICDADCSSNTDRDCAGTGGNETITAPSAGKEQKEIEFEEEHKKNPAYLAWILLLFGIIIFVLIFLFIRKKKENQTINSLRQYISENIRKGFTLQQIKDVLYRAGYNENEINKAVRSI